MLSTVDDESHIVCQGGQFNKCCRNRDTDAPCVASA